MSTDGLPADYRSFFVPGHTWFIAPFPRPSDPADLVRGIRQVGAVNAAGQEGTAIPLFSDLDLAETFLAKLDDRVQFKPLSFASNVDVAVVLAELLKLGETHVLFDPQPTLDPRRLFPIVRVIEGIAASHGKGGTAGEGH